MGLDKDQKTAYKYIMKMRRGICRLQAAGGAGKSFLLREVVKKKLKSMDKKERICILAPTHIAKLQFIGQFPDDDRIEINTVASFLSQFPIPDKITGELKFQMGGCGEEPGDFILLIVDEVSMLGKHEAKELKKLSKHIPVIYSGDVSQLRPVMKKHAETLFDKIKTFYLTGQHRNKGEVYQLCERLRDELEYPSENKEGIKVFKNRDKMQKHYIKTLKKSLHPWDISWLAYTNVEVRRMRDLVHYELYGRKVLVIGQHLRLERHCKAGNRGEIIEILEIEPYKEAISDMKFTAYRVKVKNIFTGLEVYERIVSYATQDILEEKLQECYKLTAKYFKKDKQLWQYYRDIVDDIHKITFVSSPYSISIHKSQGRTIPTVYLDTQNVHYKGRDRRRLMYVGCSRTRDNLNMIKVDWKPKPKRKSKA